MDAQSNRISRIGQNPMSEFGWPENERQFKKMIELSPEAIAVHANGRILYANRAGIKLIGARSAGDLIGKPIQKFIHPDFIDVIKSRIGEVMKGNTTTLMEQRFIKLNGEVIDVEVASMPFIFQNQPAVFTIIRDITQKKKTHWRQKFLDEVNEKLFSSFENNINLAKIAKLVVPVVADYCRIVVLDDKKNIKEISVNHKDPEKISLVSKLYDNYKDLPEKTYGVQKILDSGLPEMLKKIDGKIINSIKHKELSETVKEIGLKSYMGVPLVARNKIIGVMIFSSVTDYRYYSDDDLVFAQEIGKRIALSLDNSRLYKEAQDEIQARIRIEKNLKESREKLKFLVNASKLLTSTLDYREVLKNIAKLSVQQIADWCVVDLLDDGGELTRVTIAHKDPKKVKWAEKIKQENPTERDTGMGVFKVMETGKPEFYPVITDKMLRKASKTKKRLELLKKLGFKSVMIIPLKNGKKCMGTVTFVTSDSKRHYNRTDLAMAEELISRASAALANAEMFKSSQEAITLRDNFISMASHELKTPITSLRIYNELLHHHLKILGEEKSLNYLATMSKQLERLTKLIFNMLNVSRIEAGKFKINEKLFNPDNSVKEIVEILQESMGHKIIIDGQIGRNIKGDKDRIAQVVSNLISNAAKYSPDGEKIIVRLRSFKNVAVIGVQDFGIGIPQKYHESIFERFFRVENNADKSYPGLGIGLFIAKEIVNRHGGDIWVESSMGKGSTFYFSLPAQGTS